MGCLPRLALGLATLVFLLGSALVSAQEKKAIHLPFDGPEFFCHILHSKGLDALPTLDEALRDPADTILILLGETRNPLTRRFIREGGLRKFTDEGGNVLVATDRPVTFFDFSLSVTGHQMVSSEAKAYRGNPRCPLLRYSQSERPGIPDVRDHPLFQLLLNGIATNCPSKLDVGRGEVRSLDILTFQPEEHGRGIHTHMAFSPKNHPPAGRLLFIAGHGMFLNGMLLQPDNDNFAFSSQAIHWLRAAPRGKIRSKALLVFEGEVIGDFNMNLTPAPKIPVPTVETLNRLVSGLEEEDFFHRVLIGLLGNNVSRVAPIALGLLTLGFLLYGGKKFLDGRHARETGAALAAGNPPRSTAEASRDIQLQRAVARQKDTTREARRLLEIWFDRELGLTDLPAPGESATFCVTTSFLTRRALQRQADFIVKLLQSTEQFELTRTDFSSLIQTLPALSDAWRRGQLTLLLNGKEVRHPQGPATSAESDRNA